MDLTPAFADKSELYKSVSSDSAKCTKPIGKTFNLSRAAKTTQKLNRVKGDVLK